jgi:hypothetical protein
VLIATCLASPRLSGAKLTAFAKHRVRVELGSIQCAFTFRSFFTNATEISLTKLKSSAFLLALPTTSRDTFPQLSAPSV